MDFEVQQVLLVKQEKQVNKATLDHLEGKDREGQQDLLDNRVDLDKVVHLGHQDQLDRKERGVNEDQ